MLCLSHARAFSDIKLKDVKQIHPLKLCNSVVLRIVTRSCQRLVPEHSCLPDKNPVPVPVPSPSAPGGHQSPFRLCVCLLPFPRSGSYIVCPFVTGFFQARWPVSRTVCCGGFLWPCARRRVSVQWCPSGHLLGALALLCGASSGWRAGVRAAYRPSRRVPRVDIPGTLVPVTISFSTHFSSGIGIFPVNPNKTIVSEKLTIASFYAKNSLASYFPFPLILVVVVVFFFIFILLLR